jgi:hypothetical protein
MSAATSRSQPSRLSTLVVGRFTRSQPRQSAGERNVGQPYEADVEHGQGYRGQTTTEVGAPAAQTLFWIGVSGPPKLPAHIVAAWNEALKAVLADPAVKEKMLNAGLLVSYEDAKGMLVRVERDHKKTQELYSQ